VSTAVGFNRLIANNPALSKGPIGRFVPLIAVAAANCVNIPLMRQVAKHSTHTHNRHKRKEDSRTRAVGKGGYEHAEASPSHDALDAHASSQRVSVFCTLTCPYVCHELCHVLLQREIVEGINVKTADGVVLGKSKEAAKSAVAQVKQHNTPIDLTHSWTTYYETTHTNTLLRGLQLWW
jgi:hypothetical protein